MNLNERKKKITLTYLLYSSPSLDASILVVQTKTTMKYNADYFKQLGLSMATNQVPSVGGSEFEKERTFKNFFGVDWNICAIAWALLDDHGTEQKEKIEPRHLLWALVFYKVYGTENIHCKIVAEPHRAGPAAKTFRKWVWRVTSELADLSLLVVRKTTIYLIIVITII